MDDHGVMEQDSYWQGERDNRAVVQYEVPLKIPEFFDGEQMRS